MYEDEGERREIPSNGTAARTARLGGCRPGVRADWLARSERIGRLVGAMTWPDWAEATRLDGALRLAAAPILGDLVTDLARLKALFAGLVVDDGRPVALDRDERNGMAGPGVPAPIAEFHPGRFVALSDPSSDPDLAATDPFAGLAKRVIDLLIPEMEQAFAEITVLVHEHLWNQQFELAELVEQLPSERLAALEAARPGWAAGAAEREVEMARRTARLEAGAAGRWDLGDAVADLRRALVRAIALASGREDPGSADPRALTTAAERAVGRLRELLAQLEPPTTAAGDDQAARSR